MVFRGDALPNPVPNKMRGMERGPSFPQSDQMGTNFRESAPIGINSVPPSHSTFKSRVRIWAFLDLDEAVAVSPPRLENIQS